MRGITQREIGFRGPLKGQRGYDDCVGVNLQDTLRRERHLPLWLRRTLVVIALGIAAVLVLDRIVSLVMMREFRSETRELFTPIRPPPRMVMCDSGPNPACAADAAQAARTTFAWMPVPRGYRLRWVAAGGGEEGRGLAFEEIESDDFLITLESALDPPFPPDSDAHLDRTFNVRGTIVSAYVPNDDTFPMLTLAWTHKDTDHSLTVLQLSIFDPPRIDASEFAALVGTVRYEAPREGAA